MTNTQTDVKPIRIMLVDDNQEFSNLLRVYLSKHEDAAFEVLWRKDGREALEEVERNPHIDVILMDYFMPGMNGFEVTQELRKRNLKIPVVFLTVNKDMNLAVEVMKFGVHDYLVKEEVTTPILPNTILSVLEKEKLKAELAQLEIRKKRLEAMQEIIGGITNELSAPLDDMKNTIASLSAKEHPEKVMKYLSIVRDNLNRIETTLQKLQNLNEDKTVQYIKDIKMIDLR
jgi:CheY-like chemotaxis protein